LSATVGFVGQCWLVFVQRFVQRFFLAAPLAAQEKPEAPKPKPQFNRKVYVARVSILAACVMIS
jgi:hypothetical protein